MSNMEWHGMVVGWPHDACGKLVLMRVDVDAALPVWPLQNVEIPTRLRGESCPCDLPNEVMAEMAFAADDQLLPDSIDDADVRHYMVETGIEKVLKALAAQH